jgi:hypothetical protein
MESAFTAFFAARLSTNFLLAERKRHHGVLREATGQ